MEFESFDEKRSKLAGHPNINNNCKYLHAYNLKPKNKKAKNLDGLFKLPENAKICRV
ncbi:MAG: hypothetical protein LBF33_00480 [Oscillospiraceae bacterium]|nr:hypothetical protein [Oscillospiraceae bacterium]